MRGKAGESGSILIMITWMLLVIAAVAGFLLYRAELEWAVTLNLERNRRVDELAREVLTEHLALLAADDNDFDSPTEPWFNRNGIFELERQGYRITVQVEDEGSKPRINLLGEQSLKKLLGDELSPDPVLDWIDINTEKRENGAETPYYQGLNPAYKARDAFIASLHELLQIKDGLKYYEKLAPLVTVYGGYNPNTLNAEQLSGLLLGCGIEKNRVERVIADELIDDVLIKKKYRFSSLDDLRKISAIDLETFSQIKPFLQLEGCYNINFQTKTSWELLLKEIGQNESWAEKTCNLCKVKPMASVDELLAFWGVKEEESKKRILGYLTTVSTVFRYQIWLVKNQRIFYLTTVQKRIAAGLKTKWRLQPLSWLELKDEAAPPVPKVEPEKPQEGETQENGAESHGN